MRATTAEPLIFWFTVLAGLASEAAAPAQARVPVPLITSPSPGRVHPLVGGDGVDPWGYPVRSADKLALRALLAAGRFDELTAHLEWFQAQAEANFRKEYWPVDAFDAFAAPEPSLGPLIEQWIKKTPNSFAPWVAHGMWKHAVGWSQRGEKWAAETSDTQFLKMGEEHDESRADFEQALALKPTLLVVWRMLVSNHAAAGRTAEAKKALEAALKICPNCHSVRINYALKLTPRWGGSYEAIAEFAKTAPIDQNPRLKLLAAVADLDRCRLLSVADRAKEGLAACNLAVATAPSSDALRARAFLFVLLERWTDAENDYATASKRDPLGDSRAMAEHAFVLIKLKRLDDAEREILDAWRLDSTHKFTRETLSHLVSTLVFTADALAKKGEHNAALALFDRAARLDSGSAEPFYWRGVAALERKATPEALTAFLEACRRDPRHYLSYRSAQHLLHQQGRLDEIVQLWTRFLDAVPGSPGALLQRGDAYLRLGDKARALADAKAACTSGATEGCTRAEELSKK